MSALLHLMWLASPALPVGGFSYSDGLESAVETGRVRNEADTAAWLLDQLRLGLGRNELPVVARALAAWRDDDAATVRALNDWIAQTRESRELRAQTEQMGRSMAEWLGHRPACDGEAAARRDARLARLRALAPAPTWPIAFALACADVGATAEEAASAFGFAWADGMAQAAIKAVPLGQAGGQRVLAALVDALPATIDAALALPAGRQQAFLPMLAILSAQHEVQYSRLFRS